MRRLLPIIIVAVGLMSCGASTPPPSGFSQMAAGDDNQYFVNPTFDDVCIQQAARPHVNYVDGWRPVWQPARGDRNEPEYKCIDEDTPDEFNPPARSEEPETDTGQHWFCQFSPCIAGVYQRIQIGEHSTPGELRCTVNVTVSAIASRHDSQSTDLFEFAPIEDVIRGSQWLLGVRQGRAAVRQGASFQTLSEPPVFWFDNEQDAEQVGAERLVTYSARVELEYGQPYVIAILNQRQFGERYQDSFLYDARMSCFAVRATDEPDPTLTPTMPPTATPEPTTPPTVTPTMPPTATPPPTVTVAPTVPPSGRFACEEGAPVWENDWLFEPTVRLYVRDYPAVGQGDILALITPDDSASYAVVCQWSQSDNDVWVKIYGVRAGEIIEGWSAAVLDGAVFGEFDYVD